MRSHRRSLGQDFARSWVHTATTDVAPRETRVLIEEADGAEAFAYWHLLTDEGYSVQWCPGPDGPTGGRCALVSTGHCPLVEEADVVVSALGIDRESSRNVLGAIRRQHPETPVVIQASRREFSRWENLFDGESVLRIPVTGRALLDSVEGAVAHR
jgi:hypothetical protein